MRTLSLISGLALLTGCVETQPQQPSVAVQQLASACQGGNLDACYRLEQLRMQHQANAIQAWQAYRPAPNQITYWPAMQ